MEESDTTKKIGEELLGELFILLVIEWGDALEDLGEPGAEAFIVLKDLLSYDIGCIFESAVCLLNQ